MFGTLLFQFNSGYQNQNKKSRLRTTLPLSRGSHTLTKLFPIKQELEMIIFFPSIRDNIFMTHMC